MRPAYPAVVSLVWLALKVSTGGVSPRNRLGATSWLTAA